MFDDIAQLIRAANYKKWWACNHSCNSHDRHETSRDQKYMPYVSIHALYMIEK